MVEQITPKLYFKKIIYRATHWETWHWLIKYIPMVPFWIFHCIKARSLWFFTAANPTLTFGGYEGETKREMYNQLPTGTFPKTFFVRYSMPFSDVEEIIRTSGLQFPIAAKPDVGRMGFMFRKIHSTQQMHSYHEAMRVDYLIQEFITLPTEVSVFYYRMPDESKGNITGFVKKESLSVTGDGESSLHQLMLQYPRVWFRMEEMKAKHADKLNIIIPRGESFILSNALNLSRGGKLISLEQEKDEKLLSLFDELSKKGNFYYGRYDIKCTYIADLKQAKNFCILEFNGSGAEPHHVYGNGNSLLEAIAILLDHWRILREISRANHEKGTPYWDFMRGLRHLMKARIHFNILKELELDSTTSFNRTNSSVNDINIVKAKILRTEKVSKINTNATV
jgi:hypothetical protein